MLDCPQSGLCTIDDCGRAALMLWETVFLFWWHISQVKVGLLKAIKQSYGISLSYINQETFPLQGQNNILCKYSHFEVLHRSISQKFLKLLMFQKLHCCQTSPKGSYISSIFEIFQMLKCCILGSCRSSLQANTVGDTLVPDQTFILVLPYMYV